VRQARAFAQSRVHLGLVAAHPLPDGPFTDRQAGGDRGDRLLQRQHAPYDFLSTPQRGPGILVDVHPGLAHWGDGCSPTTSVR